MWTPDLTFHDQRSKLNLIGHPDIDGKYGRRAAKFVQAEHWRRQDNVAALLKHNLTIVRKSQERMQSHLCDCRTVFGAIVAVARSRDHRVRVAVAMGYV